MMLFSLCEPFIAIVLCSSPHVNLSWKRFKGRREGKWRKEQMEDGAVERYVVNTIYGWEISSPSERFGFLMNKLGIHSMSPDMLKVLADESEE